MNPDDLAQLVHDYGPRWRLLAAQWSDAPDDCVQEALLRLIAQPSRPDNPFAWVVTVMRNLARSQARQQQRHADHHQQLVRLQTGIVPANQDQRLHWEDVQQALDRLDPRQRFAVVSKVWGELTFPEIADLMACSTATAHRLFHDGIAALQHELEVTETSPQLTGNLPQHPQPTTTPPPSGDDS